MAFTYGESEMTDYSEAMSNKDGIKADMSAKDNGSEKIMAVSRVIKDSNGANVGAVRVMTSIEEIDRQIFIILFVVFLACFNIYCYCCFQIFSSSVPLLFL